MDAVKYLKERERMCKEVDDCYGCPLALCSCMEEKNPEGAVVIVEQWAKENPADED